LHELRFRLTAAAGGIPYELPCRLRLYLESGALDHPFRLRLVPSIAMPQHGPAGATQAARPRRPICLWACGRPSCPPDRPRRGRCHRACRGPACSPGLHR
jgi:hypothetical protein